MVAWWLAFGENNKHLFTNSERGLGFYMEAAVAKEFVTTYAKNYGLDVPGFVLGGANRLDSRKKTDSLSLVNGLA